MTKLPAFRVDASDPGSRARTGVLKTPHGAVETPVFMPVATQATVKAVTSRDLDELGARVLLANAYHLALRPGAEAVAAAGGLHAFMSYDGAILTDSGGFQVMSLAPLRAVEEEGIAFKSHLDGSLLKLTPESVIELQARLGSDLWTTLDHLVRWPCDESDARDALERTMRWTDRSVGAFRRAAERAGAQALFFPIVQGSLYPELRRRAAEHLGGLPHDGVSLGGFSVGESKEKTWEVFEATVAALPPASPRYLMGVGTPEDLWDAVARGADMLDCVYPTRVARHGCAFTSGGRLNLLNSAYRNDHGPLDPACSCWVCKRHSRAYLAHLSRANELTVYALLSRHNLHSLMETMRAVRRAVLAGRFPAARAEALERLRAPAAPSR